MDKNFISSLELLLDYNEILKYKKSKFLQEKFSFFFEQDYDTLEIISLLKKLDKDDLHFIAQSSNLKTEDTEFIRTIERPVFIKSSFGELRQLLKDSFFFKTEFLGFTFTLKDEGFFFLKELKRNIVNFVLPLTKKILENSWKLLKPSQYNLFYVLYDFFNDFLNRFQNFNESLENSFLFLEGISDNFLRVLYDKESLKMIKESIILLLDENNDETIDFLFFIDNLLKEGLKASLTTYMLEFYSIFYRKKISLKDLFEKKSIEAISTDKYFTTYKVDILKKQYLKDLIKIQKQQEKSLFSLKYLQADASKIEEFIKRESSIEILFTNENFLEMIIAFSKSYLNYFKPVFMGKIDISNNGTIEKVVIFKKVWDSSFKVLESYVSKLEQISADEIEYTLKDYQGFIEAKRSGITKDKISICIQNIIWELLLIFDILLNFIYVNYSLIFTEDQKQLLSLLQLRHFPISERNSERLIPYVDFLALDYNKTIREILDDATALLGNFLLLSEERVVLEKLKIKEKLFEKNKSNIRKILQYTFL